MAAGGGEERPSLARLLVAVCRHAVPPASGHDQGNSTSISYAPLDTALARAATRVLRLECVVHVDASGSEALVRRSVQPPEVALLREAVDKLRAAAAYGNGGELVSAEQLRVRLAKAAEDQVSRDRTN